MRHALERAVHKLYHLLTLCVCDYVRVISYVPPGRGRSSHLSPPEGPAA